MKTSSNSGSLLLNTGNGLFLSSINFSTGMTPVSAAVVDMNSDSKLDIVVANYDSNDVSVILHC